MESINPDLANEWNSARNGNLTPQIVMAGSHKKVWWICAVGHEWQATIKSRANGTGCPICANKIIQKGYNDLKTTHPNLADEWNSARNGDLTPEMVVAGSRKKVWWVCRNSHEWQASVSSRTLGSGCPICSNKSVKTGINDLETIDPILAKEWNHEKNGNLTAQMFSVGSSKKVWWKCDKGHEWKTSIANRSNGTSCPFCAGNKLLIGFNDLKTVNPRLAEE